MLIECFLIAINKAVLNWGSKFKVIGFASLWHTIGFCPRAPVHKNQYKTPNNVQQLNKGSRRKEYNGYSLCVPIHQDTTHNWLKKNLAPHFHPIRSKSNTCKTNHDSMTHFSSSRALRQLHVQLRILIGSLNSLCRLWLARVIYIYYVGFSLSTLN